MKPAKSQNAVMRSRPEINEISQLLAVQSAKRSGGMPNQPIHERLHRQGILSKKMAKQKSLEEKKPAGK
jgi:hypothetical protein|tara:strand:+ start:190 stop:396 length:207 start_codon:yes stop_codon:yes gene_type:complete